MHGRTRFTSPVSIAAATAALALLGGCSGNSTAPTLASATSRYDAGQYELALAEGTSVASRGPVADRAQAELVAGMAAFQLDQFDEAERHFLAAERSSSPSIRGRARVMLANIRLEQGRAIDAATLFESGASDLTGADAEKARRYAALARDGQLGDGQSRTPAVTATVKPASPPVRTQAPRAAVEVARPRPVTPAPQAATEGTFTVRAGAYTTEAAARRRLKALATDVRRAKAPQPHIAPVTTKDGDTLFAVRIGSFRSRAEAEALLKRLARKDLAVGAL